MNKRIISTALVSTMLISSTISAIAEETSNLTGKVDEEQKVDNESTKDINETEVRATIPSTFTVTIPKKITMDGTKKTADYKVKVTGDLAGEEFVQVEPEEKVILKQSGKENIDATITQDTTIFRSSDYTEDTITGETKISSTDEPTAVGGSINASGVTAGTWSGTFLFNVKSQYINDLTANLEAGLYDQYNNLVVSWEDSGIDVATAYSTSDSADNYYKTATNSGYSILQKYPEVTKIVIPDTVESISTAAFAGCENLRAIKIPSSVTSIGDSAFSGDTNLRTVDLQAKIDTISNSMFYKCSNLKNIVIPETVTTIEGWAFQYCSSLKSITIPESVETIRQFAFMECSSLESVVIPKSVTNLYIGTFMNCTSLKSIKILGNVTTIPSVFVKGCTALTEVILPDTLTYIDPEAFSGCSSLETLKLPESLEGIGNSAFSNTKLHDLYIPSGINSRMQPTALQGVTNIIYNGEYRIDYPWGATITTTTE